MRKFIFFYLVFLLFIWFMYLGYNKYLEFNTRENLYTNENGIAYVAKTSGRNFLIHTEGEWQKTFLKGVNLGVAKPGYFPGEFGIEKKDYKRWFQSIVDMNAEVIRVYTLQSPTFYEALYEFNLKRDKPLYVIHGVWVNEEDIGKYADAYADNEKIRNDFIRDGKEIVDAIHGNATSGTWMYNPDGKFVRDISHYVIGWIFGIEFDAQFVMGTNENNKDRASYNGTYLYSSKDASPFEVFLTSVADEILTYETDKYHMQRPFAISNWLTTDPLAHPNEPSFEMEDAVSIDVEHILVKKEFEPGTFASYHIYPYYPDFLNYDTKYINSNPEKINTYKAYLNELFAHHTIPVLVAEVGLPSSRGIAHQSLYSGFNQGHLTEKQQGEMVVSLIDDIISEGYMGALIFSWQDEWFKRSWNTMDVEYESRRPMWLSSQTGEENFGLMAFDPGKKKSVCYVDGDVSEWQKKDVLLTTNDYKLSAKADEAYLYLKIDTKNYDFDKDTLIIPIDMLNDQGNGSYQGFNFERPGEFVIKINGKNNSTILVDSYYDVFYYLYSVIFEFLPRDKKFEVKNSGNFVPIYLALDRALVIPITNQQIPFKKFDSGKLIYGIGNPKAKEYNSLSDFYYKDGIIEMRIPWSLISVMDPSSRYVVNDLFASDGVSPIEIEKIYLGIGNTKDENKYLGMKGFSWKKWETPTYHERLKQSYYIIKKKFEEIE